MQLIGAIIAQTFWVLYEGGLWILVGFAVAGAIHVLVDPDRIVRHLGERSLRSAAVAAVLGAPMPLCSCGVLPTALSLRRKGASRESTLAFLITTPETGIDSMAMTLAYFGPVLAIVRPLVAIATGLVAAFLSLHDSASDDGAIAPITVPGAASGHETSWGSGEGRAPLLGRAETVIRHAAHYAFVDLLGELAFWLALAFVTTGVLAAVLPADFFARLFPSSFAGIVALAILGIPLYVCASASTPLAALFVAKGASAGAALVFLLVGPATNAATLATVTRLFGRSTLRIYLGSIIAIAIGAGVLLDLVAPGLGHGIRVGTAAASDPLRLPKVGAALVLGVLIVESLRRTGMGQGLRELAENARAASQAVRALRPRAIVASRAVQIVALLWVISAVVGGFTSVPPGARAVVQRLGRVAGTPREPGLVFATPFIDRVNVVPLDEVRERPVGYRTAPGRLNRMPVLEEALFVTADENVIDLHAEVQYRVADPVPYQLAVEAPADVLAALVRARLVEAMAGRPIDLVYTNDRAEVEATLLGRVRRDAKEVGLGVDVLGVRLLDVHAPLTVHDAFRDVASAHEDRLTTIHQATEYATGLVTVARGEAERLIAMAKADATQRVALAEGRAEAFAALAAEHRRAPRLTEDRLYLEAAERVLPAVRKVIRSTTNTHGYELWLRGGTSPIVFPPAPGSPSLPAAPPSP